MPKKSASTLPGRYGRKRKPIYRQQAWSIVEHCSKNGQKYTCVFSLTCWWGRTPSTPMIRRGRANASRRTNLIFCQEHKQRIRENSFTVPLTFSSRKFESRTSVDSSTPSFSCSLGNGQNNRCLSGLSGALPSIS
jgi:hypothetical protein